MKKLMTKLLNEKKTDQGFIAFTSLIVISATTLAIATSVALMGIDHAQGSLSISKNHTTLLIAKSCAEESLLRLRNDRDYIGGSLLVADGNCTIAVSGEASHRTISITANIVGPPSYSKMIEITVRRAGNTVNVTNWQEI